MYPITDTVSIYRLLRTGNTEAYNTSPAYTNQDMTITPLGTDIALSMDVPGFLLFEAFCFDTTVQFTNGDKIITQDGTIYILDGQPYRIDTVDMRFIKLLLRKKV